jgi:hypothetical protein
MNTKAAVAILLAAIFALSSIATITIMPVKANDETQIYIDPSVVNKTPLDVGTTFVVDVKLENYVDLAGFDIKLTWDGALITCTGVDYDATLDDLWNVDNWSVPVENSGVGYYEIVAVALAASASNTGASVLFKLTFHVDIGDGVPLQTPIHFDVVILSDNSVPIPKPIVAVATDGMYYMAEPPPSQIHDVAVINVTASPNQAYQGRLVGIDVTVANLGEAAEDFTVTAYYDINVIATQGVLNLEPSATLLLHFVWNTTGVPYCHNYTISASAAPVPYETELTNNVFQDGWVKIKLIGDLDGDGDVDIYDMVAAATAYGSKIGDPEYNEEADLAAPFGIINLYDIVTIAYHYREKC